MAENQNQHMRLECWHCEIVAHLQPQRQTAGPIPGIVNVSGYSGNSSTMACVPKRMVVSVDSISDKTLTASCTKVFVECKWEGKVVISCLARD